SLYQYHRDQVHLHSFCFFFFSSRRRHTRWPRDWSSDVCSSDLSISTPIVVTVAPAPAVRATVTTIGVDIDPDGYRVSVDDGSERAIGTNATVTIADIPAGDHAVRLEGAAANCTVDGSNPRAVTVVAAGTADVAFTVACIALTGSAAFASVSGGYFYSCAVNTDGVAYCWGNNAYGQLGDGSTIDRRTPAVVAGGLTFTLVSPGVGTTCGLTTGRR